MSQYPNGRPDRLDIPGERKAPARKERPPYQVDARFENYYDPRLAGDANARPQQDPYPPQNAYAPQNAYPPQNAYAPQNPYPYQNPYPPQNPYPYQNPYPSQNPYPQQNPYPPQEVSPDPYQDDYDYEGYGESAAEPNREQGREKRNGFGKFLLVVELLLSGVILALLLFLNILPARFLLIGAGVLLVYWLIMLGLQKARATRGFGKFLMIFMILILGVSSGYLWRTNAALSNMFSGGIFDGGVFGGGAAASKPFTVYISGNDGYGETEAEGRSDVNILLTVNPETHQIVMTTTPRDYYIELPAERFGGARDKLTHAGIYGIDVSEEVLSELYGVHIDYYVRVNFSGFENIVDSLGGVSVWSDYDFTAVSGESFSYGYNEVNGIEALAFVRERYAFTDGDFQRGRNQMYMIKAIIAKATSPSILMNYSDLLSSVESCVLTDIPKNLLTSLIRLQLDGNPEWNIVSNSVGGYGDMQPTYSGGSESLSVIWPDEESVAAAAELIRRCINGEILEGK